MTSKDRKQLELLPSAVAHTEPVTEELVSRVRRLPTFLHAWNYAQSLSMLEDKTVYTACQIDGSQWTKITKGRASPPGDERFTRFFDVVQNEIPLIWLAEARGYDFMTLRKHFEDDKDRKIAELEEENAAFRKIHGLPRR